MILLSFLQRSNS